MPESHLVYVRDYPYAQGGCFYRLWCTNCGYLGGVIDTEPEARAFAMVHRLNPEIMQNPQLNTRLTKE